MIINPQILKELCDVAGSLRQEKAENYVVQKNVNIKKVIYDDSNNFEIRSKVKGHGDIYDVYIQVVKGEIENVSCNCEDYYSHYATCKHILATIMEFDMNENYVRIFAGEAEESQNDIAMYKKYHKQEKK